MEEALEVLFSVYNEEGYIKGSVVHPTVAEFLLTSNGKIDVQYLRDSLGQTFSEKQVSKVFCRVFNVKTMPSKFTFTKEPSSITKEELLVEVYKPAKYRNVKQFIEDDILPRGLHITKEDLFAWILTTAKARVFLGDIDPELGKKGNGKSKDNE